ncbi:nuclear transport factor 2 family protein [Glaciibacter superstes]|uniref:nuclear transport factor 2 family protein n=1 Tax=Glaciibacter superstes TaxID=501023 RepID=UPI0003B2F9DB|nr:nuclear transport factor 2 family protein [Glaciibacter superstes]
MVQFESVEAWVDRYRVAWESNKPDDIRSLFTEDAQYRTEPYAEPWIGHDEIVAGWLSAADDPGETTFDWSLLGVTAEVTVIEGRAVYSGGANYRNLWVIRFADDGRATSFTEWWMTEPDPEA